MKAVHHQSASKPKEKVASGKESKVSQKQSVTAIDPVRRKLGIYDGMPGHFMSDDFCITTKEEFDI